MQKERCKVTYRTRQFICFFNKNYRLRYFTLLLNIDIPIFSGMLNHELPLWQFFVMLSQFSKNKILKRKSVGNKEEIEKLYEQTLNLLQMDAQVLWQSSEVFLLANTILFAFIAPHILNSKTNQLQFVPNLGTWVLALMGLIISIFWFFTYRRTSNYFKFHIAQARQREPEGWDLMNGDGKLFSEGNKIEILGKKYNVGIGKFFKNHNVALIIPLFIFAYLAILFITCPWGIYKR